MTTSVNDGSQTATLDVEHTLDTITDDGVYVLLVDMVNLALGDVVILRVKTKVRSGGTTRLAYEATYAHVQTELVKLSIPVPSINEIAFTLEQTDGTGRAFPWEIVRL